jgi:glycerophosphoryl diester phosphodiesterase
MRNRLRALTVVIAGGIALVIPAQIAYADSMDAHTVAHRGASTSKLGEGTLPAYQYAVKNRADILDADVRWTKDGPDADSKAHERLLALNKIKKLDAADSSHKISYALIATGTGGWPSVSAIKSVGTAVHAKLTIPADVANNYRLANVKVYLYTARNASDEAKMIALQPYGVVVDDLAQFQAWRDTASGSA